MCCRPAAGLARGGERHGASPDHESERRPAQVCAQLCLAVRCARGLIPLCASAVFSVSSLPFVQEGREHTLQHTQTFIRAILLPAGSHTVRFSYFPRSLGVGIAISACAAALLLAAFCCLWRDQWSCRCSRGVSATSGSYGCTGNEHAHAHPRANARQHLKMD